MVAIAFLTTGAVLAHRIDPGVRVKTVTIAGHTPALQFSLADSAPHPVALLAHGLHASKETLFRLGEALATAGFVCFALDSLVGAAVGQARRSNGSTYYPLTTNLRSHHWPN